MKKFISLTSVLAALALLAASCSYEKEMSDGPSVGQEATLLLKLRTPGDFASPSSRSLTFAQENAINTVHVLVFDNTNTLVDIRQGQNVSSTPGGGVPNVSGSGSFSVTLAASKTAADTYNLVVLANAQTIVAVLGGVQSIADRSYASVTARLYGQITGAMYPSGGEIPMWGETGQVVVQPGSSVTALQLRRAVARVDVGVGTASYNSTTHAWSWNGRDASNAAIPFSLAHVYIVRPNNRYAVVPDRTKAAGEPTVPAGTTAFTAANSKTYFAFAASGGCVTQSVYVPEANVRMGASGKPGDANHTGRMAVVVGGYYNGSATETFYRLDFAQGGNLINVLRNRLYRFDISKAAGAGYADVETAYNSLAMNMTAEIVDWDVTDMGGAAFDGQYALSVSRTAVELNEGAYTAASSDNKLRIRTDWPAGWTVAGITDNATGNAATWLSLAAADRTGTDKTVSLLLNSNTGAVRTARIRITAGRMATEVAVTQGYAPALTHTSNTLPASGIIPNTGGTYTINVSTNLQDWGVKVYAGTGTTPIITKAANPSPAINRNAAARASSTTVTIPSTTAGRNLAFTVFAGEAGEVSIGSLTQSAYAAVLTHTSNTLPASGIIPNTGGTYTINVSTNLQSWGVKVYQGAGTTPIVTKAANPSPAINRYAAPVASSTTITIPTNILVTTTPDKGLVFVLYANEGAEVRVGSFTQKGYDRVGDNRHITWNGSGYILTADPTDAGLYFKFGSVVGVYSGNGAVQTLPSYANSDGFDPGDVAWSPVTISGTGVTGWATVPVYNSYPANIDAVYHTAANVKAGRGDPCRLVGLDLNRIRNTAAGSLTAADIDNGTWRLPTNAENQAFSGQNANVSYTAHWTTTLSGVPGGMFPNTTSGSAATFLPAAGGRNYSTGTVESHGNNGNYWSYMPNSSSDGYCLRHLSGSVSPLGALFQGYGLSVRCVRQ